MEDQKPLPGFSPNQNFAEGIGLEPKVKMHELGDALSKLVQLKRREFLYFLEKIAILKPLNLISPVFRAI